MPATDALAPSATKPSEAEAIKEMHPYSKSRVKVVLEPGTDQDTIVSTERSAEFKKWLVGE